MMGLLPTSKLIHGVLLYINIIRHMGQLIIITYVAWTGLVTLQYFEFEAT